jgi:hypothetical protein
MEIALVDRTEFKEWFEGFIKPYGEKSSSDRKDLFVGSTTRRNYYPDDMDAWIEKVDQSHTEVRELLGGVRRNFQFSCKNEQQIHALDDCSAYVNAVVNCMPEYLSTYGLEKEDLAYPNLKKCKNISTTKHILGYADRAKITGYNLDCVRSYVTSLGNVYARRKAVTGEFSVTISTHPKAFCQIGSYGIDNSSCFMQGAFNSDKKYTYGAHKDTAVFLIREGINDLHEDKKGVICRALITFTEGCQIMNLSNSKTGGIFGYDYNKIVPIVNKTCAELFGTDQIASRSNLIVHKGGINYLDYICLSLFDGKKRNKIDNQVIDFDDYYSKESHPENDPYANWKK